MSVKPSTPAAAIRNDLKLALKDGLRDLRFSMRTHAQSLARRLEASSQRPDDADGPLGHLPRLGEPIVGAAARTAAQLIESADHAAHALLRPNDEHRRLGFRLQPAARHFAGGADASADGGRHFTKTHYWAIRHLLALRGIDDAVVHEQAVQAAWRRITDAAPATPAEWLAADVVVQLNAPGHPALLRCAGDAADAADATQALIAGCSAAVVIAGEIAPQLPHTDVPSQTRAALAMAGEAVWACLPDWQRALRSRHPLPAVADSIAFTLRHL